VYVLDIHGVFLYTDYMITKISTMKLKVGKLSELINKLLIKKITEQKEISEQELQALRTRCEEVEKLLDIS